MERKTSRLAGLFATLLALTLGGCQGLTSGFSTYFPNSRDLAAPEGREVPAAPMAIDAEVYRRAESERADWLEREVARLRADMHQAEEALISAESGLRGSHSRADAVSSLAEARIQIERVSDSTPWRAAEIAEARAKLDDADAQIEKENFGAVIFFVYSAKRIATSLESDTKLLGSAPNARFVRAHLVNLRSGPSTEESVVQTLGYGTPVFSERDVEAWSLVRTLNGRVGWVHGSLLEAR